MSNENIPERINPYRFAEAETKLTGVFQIKNMERLCKGLANDGGQVEFSLQFGVDEQGTRFIRGHVETALALQCQRCMESFIYDIIADFLSGVVKSENDAKLLSTVYEPVLATDDNMLVIQDMIEDELIMALPIVPMHNIKECKVQLPRITLGSDAESEKDDSNNPFKVIEILRVKRDSNRN